MTTPEETAAAREARVNAALGRIVAMFTSGDLPAAIATTELHRLADDAPSARWSLGNQLLMLVAGTTDARGFNQWKAVGRSVSKGAHCFHILAPRTVKVTITDPDTGEESRQPRCVGFLTVPVFRYEDTDGEPIVRPDYTPPAMPPLFEVAQRYGVHVEWGPVTERFRGYFQPAGNRIMLCTHDVSVFFHELAHAVHHSVRPLQGGQVPSQEIVAEAVAASLCHLYGFDGFLWHGAEYVKSYAGKEKNPGAAVMRVLGDVQKVLGLILGAHEAASVNDPSAA